MSTSNKSSTNSGTESFQLDRQPASYSLQSASNPPAMDITGKEIRRKYLILPLAAGLSGMVEACTTHPLDRIKTEMQRLTLEKQPHVSVVSAIRSIYYSNNSAISNIINTTTTNNGTSNNTHGSTTNTPVGAISQITSRSSGSLAHFYQGIVPRLAGIVPMRLVYWGTLNTMNDWAREYVETKHNSTNRSSNNHENSATNTGTSSHNTSNNYSSSTANMSASLFIVRYLLPGMVAGAVQSIVDNPIEVLKTKLMTSNHSNNANTSTGNHSTATESAKRPLIWRYHQLYDGFLPLICRNMMFAICVGSSTQLFGQEHPFFSAAMGGLVGSLISQPFDVLKTEMQRYRITDYHNNNSSSSANHNNTQNERRGRLRRIVTELFTVTTNTNSNKLAIILRRCFAGASMRCLLGFANMGIGFVVLSHIRTFVTRALEDAPQ